MGTEIECQINIEPAQRGVHSAFRLVKRKFLPTAIYLANGELAGLSRYRINTLSHRLWRGSVHTSFDFTKKKKNRRDVL